MEYFELPGLTEEEQKRLERIQDLNAQGNIVEADALIHNWAKELMKTEEWNQPKELNQIRYDNKYNMTPKGQFIYKLTNYCMMIIQSRWKHLAHIPRGPGGGVYLSDGLYLIPETGEMYEDK